MVSSERLCQGGPEVKSVGILVAMWEELNPLRKAWQLEWTGPGEFFCGRQGELRLQVALSGVGPRRAREATQKLLSCGQPEILVSLGYSGALKEELQAGDCLLAHSIESGHGKFFKTPGLSTQERHCGAWKEARLLCVNRLAPTVESKRQLASLHPQAEAVDMESAVLAEGAEQAGLPWRALRVVMDPLASPLPIDFDRCVSERGQTSTLRLAREVALNPGRIPALLRFAGYEKRARRSLVERSRRLLEVMSW